MVLSREINQNRFTGFADVYDTVRPALPDYPIQVIVKYLGKKPERVVDLGCGTGLSTIAWKNQCQKIVGVDPNDDMLAIARAKECDGISFVKAFGHDTGLAARHFDAVVCSQSFHWMEPEATLQEIARILKKGGVFAAIDCDWPPVTVPHVEKAYCELFEKVEELTDHNEKIKNTFYKWNKEHHLDKIQQSGLFSYAREIVFAHEETCTAERLIGLAVSQGNLQALFKHSPEWIAPYFEHYREQVYKTFQGKVFTVDFCYRMRIAVK